MKEFEVLVCECSSVEHQLIINYDENDNKAYVSIHLIPESNIFKRIWYGIKYIFGYKCKWGNFEEVILGRKHSKALIELGSMLQSGTD